MYKLKISTEKRQQILDITQSVKDAIAKENFSNGIITVFSPHTTAGITVNENADPNVKKDINYFLSKMVPENSGFSHCEGNSDAHIKGSLVNFSQNFIVENGQLQLGTWQGIFLMEFDGPRPREVWIKFISEK